MGSDQCRLVEGVTGEHYQGNTEVIRKAGALPRHVLNREVPRKRRFTYEYEGVLALCEAYFERVCPRVLSLRQFPVANFEQRTMSAEFLPRFKGVC